MSPGGNSVLGAVSPSDSLLSCNEDHCFKVAVKPEEGIYRISDRIPPFVFSDISVNDSYSKRNDCPIDIWIDPVPYESAVVKHGMLNRMSGKSKIELLLW